MTATTTVTTSIASGVTIHNMFCGAGGMTTGAKMAGAIPVVAMNHWPVACESYGTNHPEARVDCADVCTVDPRRYPPATVLLAEPECTHHSYARGRPKDDPNLFDPDGDKAAERSRATMWDVVRFAEYFDYEAIIVENVPAATKWGGRQGQKLKHDEYGHLFAAWLYAMDGLGYDHEVVHLNSMMCGVPQSRDRIYVVFWRKGDRRPDLEIRPTAWCTPCGRLVRGRQVWKRSGAVRGEYDRSYVYRCPECSERVAPVITPAAAAIDWSLPAIKIGEREKHGKKPLREATIQRIRRGVDKLAARPPGLTLNELLSRGADVDPEGLASEVAGHHPRGGGLVVPAGGPERAARSTDEPMGTVLGRESQALVVPTTHGGGGDRSRSVHDPLPAQTGRQEQALVVSNMTGNVPKNAGSEPMGTVTTGNKLGLVYAGRESAVPRDAAGEPMQTQTAINSLYVAQVDLRNNNVPRLIDEPMSTIAARGTVHGLAYIVGNYTPGWVRDAGDRPLGTITTADHHSLLTYRGPGDVRSTDEPVSTIATVAEHALLSGATVDLNECRFRMLEPVELKLGSGFPLDYVMVGAKRDQVAQTGNAVNPPVGAVLFGRVVEFLHRAGG